MRIYTVPALKLKPAMNSVAFFTYIIKFSDLKWVSFMSYTHDIQGWGYGTRHIGTDYTHKEGI